MTPTVLYNNILTNITPLDNGYQSAYSCYDSSINCQYDKPTQGPSG